MAISCEETSASSSVSSEQDNEVSGCCGWLRSLRDVFGGRLLTTLFLAMGILKGFCGGGGNAGLVGVPVDFLFREFGLDASNLQIYKSAVLIPWSIKPLLGLLSDLLPTCGFHRRSYLAIIGVFGSLAYAALPLWPGMGLHSTLGFLFVMVLQIAWTDLLIEAVYSVRLRDSPMAGPDLISFVWGTIAVCKLGSTAAVGYLIQTFGPRSAYALGFPFAALTLLIPALNLIDEPRSKVEVCRGGIPDWPLAVVAVISGFGALSLSALSMSGADLTTKVIGAAALGVVVLGLFSFTLSPVIAKINAFFFLHNVCAFSIEGGSFYFFTDDEEKYPEGPHFSTSYYTSVLGLVSTVATLLGMFIYNRWMKKWRYQRVLVVGNVLASAVQLASCFVYLRWNLRVGINDHFFVMASSGLSSVIFELAWLPGMLIISQLCPPGKEATMFALLAGSGNLGMNLGGYFGAFLLHMLGVEPQGRAAESSQFDNLWLAALIAAAAPILPLLLIPYLVPDVTQQEPILGLKQATEGSLLEGFCPHLALERPSGAHVELHNMVGSPSEDSEKRDSGVE